MPLLRRNTDCYLSGDVNTLHDTAPVLTFYFRSQKHSVQQLSYRKGKQLLLTTLH